MVTTGLEQEDRVQAATPGSLNDAIEQRMWERVGKYFGRSREDITARIVELEKEWDIERYLGVNMSILALSGLAAGTVVNTKWLALPGLVLGFFLQHSLQGWCPPLPLLRLLHIRTKKEIEQEKYALKVIRGDFDNATMLTYRDVALLKSSILKG